MAELHKVELPCVVFPDSVSKLEATDRSRIQDACLAYQAGRHDIAKERFASVERDESRILSHLEKIEMEKSRGDFISALQLIKEAVDLLKTQQENYKRGPFSGCYSDLEAVLRITKAQIEVNSHGWLYHALEEAQIVRRSCIAEADVAQVSDVQVRLP